ncbi:MAG: MFS transporter, partial [Nocardioides sp.]|nr:MFS transporter [Nocardioides sp.]
MPGQLVRLRDRVLSDDRLIRSMSYQSVLSAFGEGAFVTGEAVYFTHVVGLHATQVGVGLTVAGIVTFLVAVPLGRLADVVGTKRTWVIGSLLEALTFAAWLIARDFAAFLAVTVLLEVVQTWMRAGRNAYRLDVFPRAERVRSNAYMRAARNVGYTLGALAAGLALATDDDRVIEAVPLVTALLLLLNTYWVTRLPSIARHEHETPLEELAEHKSDRRSALRNRPFLLTMFFDGVLGTHAVLLNTVIPLWLVTQTDAPRVLLAWLYGTNTVLAVLLQVRAARGVDDVRTSLRA